MAAIGKRVILLAAVGLVLGLAIGIVIGYFINGPRRDSNSTEKTTISSGKSPGKTLSFYKTLGTDGDPEITQKLVAEINAEKIRATLKELTREPHVAGTSGSYEQALKVKSRWEDDLDDVVLETYDVLLSYPPMPPGDNSTANKVQLVASDGSVVFQTQITEDPRNDSDLISQKMNILPPFNAYAKAGNITGADALIYVNYGRVEDFQFLERNTTISVKDKIVIARYGKIYRGDKVNQAHKFGAKAVILYSDPADYYAPKTPGEKPFPDSWWLPGTGVQRGSTFLGDGDPQTPHYPSLPYAYRNSEAEYAQLLPQIPVHPIGYNDAKVLLDSMFNCTKNTNEVPDNWRGALNGTVYCYGGKLKKSMKINMFVNNTNEIRKAWNVIGTIRGSIEPDRYVLMGNHRDAWIFGAVDPTTGTATMLEMTRAIGKVMKETKWRPRRSLVFCSWGAEEYALIGSTEWVEENMKKLVARAVAYINVDVAVQYHGILHASGSPMLKHAIIDATRKIPNPATDSDTDSEDTLYHANEGHLKIGQPGSGSDHAPFYIKAGVPVVSLGFTYSNEDYNISGYPMYHSVYETFQLVEKFIDPNFRYHQAMARLCSELVRSLSDTVLIPMNVSEYAEEVSRMRDNLMKLPEFEMMKNNAYKDMTKELDYFINVTEHLKAESISFQTKLSEVDKYDPYLVRRYNDQMMQLERAFTDPLGLPGRADTKHVVSAPSSKNQYAGSSFPGLSDALFDIGNCNTTCADQWTLVAKQLSIVTYTIQSAAGILQDVTPVMRTFP